MKKVFINKGTGAMVIVSTKNSYEYSSNESFTELFEGNNNQSLNFIEDYWSENNVLDEQRMYLQD